MYDLAINFLVNNLGFTVPRSGDGLAAFDDTGTSVITSGFSGANGFANNDAWLVVQDPAGEYEWLFQRNASDVSWEVAYSAVAGFTGGAAATKPTATDEVQIIDGTLFIANNFYRWHLEGDDAPISGVYRWSAIATTNGTGLGRTWIGHEALAPGSFPTLVGTRAAPITGEPDPSIQIAKYNLSEAHFHFGGSNDQLGNDTSSPLRGWWCYGGTNGQAAAYEEFQAAFHMSNSATADQHYPANTTGNDGVGVDPRDGSDPVIAFHVGRDVSHGLRTGPKGVIDGLRAKGVAREYPDTIDIAGDRFVYLGDLLFPFENGGTPLT